jgi:aminotransferase EvaB
VSVKIPRFDYLHQYQALRSEILAAVSQVLGSGNLILGPRVKTFEESMCRFLAGSGYAVGVGSGTDALAIALRALEVGVGDEVITVANTAVPTVSAIRSVGATPVFCDILPDTLLMDPTDMERRITPHTRAILPVHLFGNAVDMAAVNRIAERHSVHVVEDCAQACGTLYRGRPVGTWGDIGCFSFYPTKNLGAYGDGGLCFTWNRHWADAMRQIRTYGCDASSMAQREGINSRLDEIQAAILEVKLRYLPEYLRQRRCLATVYARHLAPWVVIPCTTPGTEHSHHLFVIQAAGRDHVIDHLRSQGVECGIHYPTPIHRMPAYRFLNYELGSLPVTEQAASQVLSLPCYPELSVEAVQTVCSAVNQAIQEVAA